MQPDKEAKNRQSQEVKNLIAKFENRITRSTLSHKTSPLLKNQDHKSNSEPNTKTKTETEERSADKLPADDRIKKESESNDCNWDSKESGNVQLRVKMLEKEYQERQMFRSIFCNAPFYQEYNQKIKKQESKRVMNKQKILAKINADSDLINNLEFENQHIFDDIDGDEDDEPQQRSQPMLEKRDSTTKSSTDKTIAPTEAQTDATTISPMMTKEDSNIKNETSSNKPGEQQPLANKYKFDFHHSYPSKTNPLNMEEGRDASSVHTDKTSSFRISNANKYQSKYFSKLNINQQQLINGQCLSNDTNTFINKVAGVGPSRATWLEMMQIINPNLTENLQPHERKLNEALFEIITSEASYYRTLNAFVETFYMAPCMQPEQKGTIITGTQKHHLFSNILEIYFSSQNFLSDMEHYFREKPMIEKLCEIVYEYSEFKCDSYVKYVQNQIYQLRTLSKLLAVPAFTETIKHLQSQASCGYMDLNSFLLLPMQRVTRLRLLVSTVLNYAPKNSITYQTGLVALASLENLIHKCETKKTHMEHKERLMELCQKFQYKCDVKALATESRTLKKEGHLPLVSMTDPQSVPIYKKIKLVRKGHPTIINLFLFSDQLLIAKKKSNDQYMVEDNCQTNFINIEITNTPPEYAANIFYHPDKSEVILQQSYVKHSTVLDLKSNEPPVPVNSPNKDPNQSSLLKFKMIIEGESHPRVQYEFEVESISKRERWVDALCPSFYGLPVALSTEILECPQVLITKQYSPIECDELELKEGDQVSILISLSDGWLKGTMVDGRTGWFPGHICVEVKDANMKRENTKNFLLIEEARKAYAIKKNRETFKNFLNRSNEQFL